MSSTVVIRSATTSDAAAISDLILRALHEVNIRDYGPVLIAEQAKNWTVDGVVSKMQTRATYVAVDGNNVVGTAGFDGKQVRTVFVRPDQHKRGVGSLLMRAVEALAIERGLDRLSLLSSITAQGFYQRLGYNSFRDVFHGAERTILKERRLAKSGA
jgi:N-acetylglutamate synthase-like GNAT family acetyltransferase